MSNLNEYIKKIGSKNLIIIGSKNAFYRGINNSDHYIRKTYLKERLWQIQNEQNRAEEKD